MAENDKKLYPLKFKPVSRPLGYGTETFHIADTGEVDSAVLQGWLEGNTLGEIMETFLDGISGEGPYYYTGRQFPLMIRTLQTVSDSPVLVSPSDAVAASRYDSLGKAKLWYVLDASKGSFLRIGLAEDVSAENFCKLCADGTLHEAMNNVEPVRGKAYLIKPGTLHQVSAGIKILEIAQASALEIPVCGGGAGIDVVYDVIDFVDLEKHCGCDGECHCHDEGCGCGHDGDCECGHHHDDGEDHHHHDDGKIADTQEFTVTRLELADPMHIYPENFGSFLVYTCLEGSAAVRPDDGAFPCELAPGESVLIPADMQDLVLFPQKPGTVLLESVMLRDLPPQEDAA